MGENGQDGDSFFTQIDSEVSLKEQAHYRNSSKNKKYHTIWKQL
jgi:hypothetical protein